MKKRDEGRIVRKLAKVKRVFNPLRPAKLEDYEPYDKRLEPDVVRALYEDKDREEEA